MSKTKKTEVEAVLDEGQAERLAAAGAVLAEEVAGEFAPMSLRHFDILDTEAMDCLRVFFRANPDAPDAAGLIQHQRVLGRHLLPALDPRFRLLTVRLFRTALAGVDAIVRQDAERMRMEDAAEAAAVEASRPVPESRKALKKVKGVLAPSDFGKAMGKR